MGQPLTAALVALFLMGALMVAAALSDSRPSVKMPRKSLGRHAPAVVPAIVTQAV